MADPQTNSQATRTGNSAVSPPLIPAPSGSTASCVAFYNNPRISAKVTRAFQANAVDACIVTGSSTQMSLIRKNLQIIYSTRKPADGKTFTYSEHKTIHDDAYLKSGCTSGSANIIGWYLVDTIEHIPRTMVGWSIDIFGKCTVRSSTPK
ncbi:MAG: hypothetical protein KDA88_02505 [Planctomycetaceae bacterium]|nr:hypothetical protein [Planctomycetaceae bacterium]